MPIIDNHAVRVLKAASSRPTPGNILTTLFWGDEVQSVSRSGKGSKLVLGGGRVGWTTKPVRLRKNGLLKATILDVGQGDACLLESPTGKTILVDGGETQRLARYIAKRFGGPTRAGQVFVTDAIVVTHGDADHYVGLSILATDAAKEDRPDKQILFATKRVFHNGLVKRAPTKKGTKLGDRNMFGSTVSHKGELFITDLVDDLVKMPLDRMNVPFRGWAKALRAMKARHPLVCKRMERGDNSEFDFFDPNVEIQVLGPSTQKLPKGKRALPFLSAPGGSSPSGSHTINGHSIVLRLKYKHVRFLLAADLNAEAEDGLLKEAKKRKLDLESEVLKVPHHGSGDFATEFFNYVKPIVSVVSTGDEDARHEYIHPRANLMGALGKGGRTTQPIIMVTDLAAFDRYVGPALPARRMPDGSYQVEPKGKWFYGRERTAFGAVHTRTDGEFLFIGTHSGVSGRNEMYVFCIDAQGNATPVKVDQV